MSASEHLNSAQFETNDYEGRVGDKSHITRVQRGMLPVSAIKDMPGARGEVPGEHRNKQGEQWTKFVDDVRTNGVQRPVFITMDYGEQPKMSEGNHRRDAAVEAGVTHVPFEARFFGHAERQHRGWD